jgi:hypothetical protein
MRRHFIVNGITVKKTAQTVESARITGAFSHILPSLAGSHCKRSGPTIFSSRQIFSDREA